MREETIKENKNKRAIKKKCPACGWPKMFTNRGEIHPTYTYKCCVCGAKI